MVRDFDEEPATRHTENGVRDPAATRHDARMTLPAGFTARPHDPTDAQAVFEVVHAAETHDLGEARRLAGEIVLLHRGAVIERGDAETFFAAPRTEAARRFIAGELLV